MEWNTESMDWPTTHTAVYMAYRLTVTDDDEFSVYRWSVQEVTTGQQPRVIDCGTAFSLKSAKLAAVECLELSDGAYDE